jgi:hypothetical protein
MRRALRDLGGRLRPSAAAPATKVDIDDVPARGDAEWPKHVASRGLRVQPLTALLGVVLVATLGIWGGAELQQRHGSTAAAASPLGSSPFANRGAGQTGFPGAGRGNFTGNLTTGIVTVISGKTLYLTSSSGAIVKVKLTDKTTYTRTATTASTGLKPGDTAIVQGSKNTAGVTVATSVTATAKGVTAATGRFPGGFVPTSGTSSPSG